MGVVILSQPHLFFRILSHATLDTMVSLYLAIPPGRRSLFFHPVDYRKLVKIACAETFKRDGVFLDVKGSTDFASFVRFLHLHQHSIPMFLMIPSEYFYMTNAYAEHPVKPPTQEYYVSDCCFLPRTAPGKFSNNLVVLGYRGELQLFAPQKSCFRLTAKIQLQCYKGAPTHTLVISPLGRSLLVMSHEDIHWFRLRDDGFDCISMCIPKSQEMGMIHDACFFTENHFISSDRKGDVLLHSVMGKSKSIRVTPYGIPRKIWISDGEAPFNCLNYKRGTTNTPNGCLVVSRKIYRRGHGHQLKLYFDGIDEPVLLTFRQCVIVSHLMHPDQESLFVVVITTLPRRNFLSSLFLPHRQEEALTWFDHDVTGHVGVYQLTFQRSGDDVRVRPRWYLNNLIPRERLLDHFDLMRDNSRRLYPHSPTSERMSVGARIDRTHLSVMVNTVTLAHLPLWSGPDCSIVYEHRKEFRHFCFSEEHTFGAFFSGDYAYRRCFFNGAKICSDYDILHGDINKINLKAQKAIECRIPY